MSEQYRTLRTHEQTLDTYGDRGAIPGELGSAKTTTH